MDNFDAEAGLPSLEEEEVGEEGGEGGGDVPVDVINRGRRSRKISMIERGRYATPSPFRNNYVDVRVENSIIHYTLYTVHSLPYLYTILYNITTVWGGVLVVDDNNANLVDNALLCRGMRWMTTGQAMRDPGEVQSPSLWSSRTTGWAPACPPV